MKVDLNNNWIFNSDFDKLPDGDEVRIPHTVKVTPLNYFSESLYQEVSGYLKYIDVPSFAAWLIAHDILGDSDGCGSNIFLT